MSSVPTGRLGAPGIAIALWAVGGFAAVLVHALGELTPRALAALTDYPLSSLELLGVVGWVAFMAYSEGYKGFQRQMSPRVAARAVYAGRTRSPYLSALAPLFAMGLLHANRKRLAVSWGITVGVVVLILIVRLFDQPLRGLVDAGVVIGLGWGLVATVVYGVCALIGREPDVPLDLPE